MTPAVQNVVLNAPFNPYRLPNLAARYDLSYPASTTSDYIRIDASNRVSLLADTSGNSAVNCYVSNVAAGSFLSAPNKSVTGNQVFTLDVELDTYAPASDVTLVNKLSGNDGFKILVLTTGVVRLQIGDGASVTNVDSSVSFSMTALTRYSIGITWNDGVGASFTKGGVAVGTAVAAAKTLTNAAVVCAVGTVAGKIYRFQAAGVYDCNPSLSSKKVTNADTFSSGGDTWTLTTTGATGGRISGARDLYQGTAANQPVYLAWAGANYGYLNAVSGNYFSTPDLATPTGDIDLRAEVAPISWTPSVNQAIISKDDGAANREWLWVINAAGTLQFFWWDSGGTLRSCTSSVATGFSAGARRWLRVTLDVDNGAGGNAVTFYTSTDGSSWTQLGTVQSGGAFTTSIRDQSAAINIGSSASGTGNVAGTACNYYHAQILNGIAGTVVADFNPALYTSGTTFTASTGEVWTANGGAAIVTRTCLYFDGSNDYLKAAPFSLSQPETVYFTGSQVSFTDGDTIFDGNALNTGRLLQKTTTPNTVIYGGSSEVGLNTDWAIGTTAIKGIVFNGAASSSRTNRNAAVTGSGGTASMSGFTLGANGTPGGYGNITANEALIYSAAHDTTTQDRVVRYDGRKWSIAL